MESKKLQRPRWLDSFLGPKNSKSQWLQDNLEEMNRNFRRMLKIIEDSNAESFSKKVEMYYESRQELINLVYKCYGIHGSLATRHNHATGEPLINIPNLDLIRSQGRDIIMSNDCSAKSIPLSKFPSSKQINAPVCSVSKQLKRRVSVKGPKWSKQLKRRVSVKGPKWSVSSVEKRLKEERPMSYSFKETEHPTCYSESHREDDDVDDEEELQHEGTDELEAELCNMIEKLYIQMEGDRDVSKLQGKIWRHEDNACDYDGEFRKVKELASSNVDKALLEEKMELNAHSKEGLQNLQSQQRVKISMPPAPMTAAKKIIRFSLPYDSFSSSDDSYTQSDDDDDDDDGEELQHEGTDELEAELRDMIEKLYIQMEGDRDVSKLQGEIWRHEDNACDYDGEFRKVKELASSNVDKALLEEKMELNVHSKEGLQNLQSQQRVKISTPPAPMSAAKKIIRFSLPYDSFSSSDDSYTQSDDDDDDDGEELQHEGTDELEAELRDMIEKLYIEMEGDRVVSMLQGGGILRYEDNGHDDDEEFRQVRESISSNVDKALLEENLELQANICRLLKDISSLEEYNEESNERCESLDEALSQAIEERTEAETLFAWEVEQLKASIVKKNNDVEELNKILEAVAAERDQLKARVAMFDADPCKS